MKTILETFLTAIAAGIIGIFILVLIGLGFSWFLAILWNAVMPDIFNLPEVTAWQMFLMYLLINLAKNGISFNMKNKKNENV
jgi:hypothetical protein